MNRSPNRLLNRLPFVCTWFPYPCLSHVIIRYLLGLLVPHRLQLKLPPLTILSEVWDVCNRIAQKFEK